MSRVPTIPELPMPAGGTGLSERRRAEEYAAARDLCEDLAAYFGSPAKWRRARAATPRPCAPTSSTRRTGARFCGERPAPRSRRSRRTGASNRREVCLGSKRARDPSRNVLGLMKES